MRYAIGFSIFILVLFLGSIEAAYAEPFPYDDLTPTYLVVDQESNSGIMIIYWKGLASLETYENRWLDFGVSDIYNESSTDFQLWFRTWRGVCKPPCELTVDFIIRNVTTVTK